MAELYRKDGRGPSEPAEDEQTRAEAFCAICSLVSAVVPKPEDGKLKVDLLGDVSHILALASAKK